jgi:hypothetical protein
MRYSLRTLLGSRRNRGVTPRHPIVTKARPRVEMLEDRTVPTVILPPPGVAGPVQILGTAVTDNLSIRLVQGQTPTLALSDGVSTVKLIALDRVTSISVSGFGGNDTLTLDNGVGFLAKSQGLPITFDGGAGANQLLVQGQGRALYSETYGPTSLGMTLVTAGPVGNTVLPGTQTIYLKNVAGVTDSVPVTGLTLTMGNEIQPVGPATTDAYQIVNGAPLPGGPAGMISTIKVAEVDIGAAVGTSFTPFTFANKTNVSMECSDSDDTIIMNTTTIAAGLQSFYIDGGKGYNTLVVANMPTNMNCTWDNIQNVIWNPGQSGGGSGGAGAFAGTVSPGSPVTSDALPPAVDAPITEV